MARPSPRCLPTGAIDNSNEGSTAAATVAASPRHKRSKFTNPPLLVVARSERILCPIGSRSGSPAEPQPIRLPPPTFVVPPDSPNSHSPGDATGGSGQLMLPGEETPGGVAGLVTPPDGPKRRGFFAMTFGPGIEAGGEMLSDIRFDYRNFYSARSLLWLGAGIGVAGILANTSVDQHFRNWYQDDVRAHESDQIHNDIAWLGNGGIMLPIWLGTSFVFTPFEEYSQTAHLIGTWGRKSTRAFLVGGPMLLALQYGLGAHRPSADLDSHWHPFPGQPRRQWRRVDRRHYVPDAREDDRFETDEGRHVGTGSISRLGAHRRRPALPVAGHARRVVGRTLGRSGRHHRSIVEDVHRPLGRTK